MLMNLFPKFKIVEINNVAALRMGHVIAQTPAYVEGRDEVVAPTYVGADNKYAFVENGLIVGYDRSGVLANYDAAKHGQPCLVYTEELITANYIEGLDQYANYVGERKEEGASIAKPVYLRALPLNLGDTFTTNNISNINLENAKYASVENGKLKLSTSDEGAMFIAKLSNLPAGQKAYEFTYIGFPAKVAA